MLKTRLLCLVLVLGLSLVSGFVFAQDDDLDLDGDDPIDMDESKDDDKKKKKKKDDEEAPADDDVLDDVDDVDGPALDDEGPVLEGGGDSDGPVKEEGLPDLLDDDLLDDDIPESRPEEDDLPPSRSPSSRGTNPDLRSSTFDPSKAIGDLPPEPPADGIAGAWYLVDVSCINCSDILEQEVLLDAPIEVIRGFNDQFIVNPSKTVGEYSEPSAARKKPLAVIDQGDGYFAFVTFTSGSGARITDRLAQVWRFRIVAEEKLLYGRQYDVIALDDDLWVETEEGFSANTKNLGAAQLGGLTILSMVEELTKEEPLFEFSDSARIEFSRAAAAIRSDFSTEVLEAYQSNIRTKLESQKKLRAEIDTLLASIRTSIDEKEWGRCARTLNRIHELGFENDDTHYNLGKCFERAGDQENAAIHYGWVLEKVPRDIVTLFRLASVYEKMERYQDAMGLYTRIKKATREGSKDWTDAHYRRLELLEKVYKEQ